MNGGASHTRREIRGVHEGSPPGPRAVRDGGEDELLGAHSHDGGTEKRARTTCVDARQTGLMGDRRRARGGWVAGWGRGTHSLRRCSSMHRAQKRWRHGDTTLTFFSVPQHTAHRVSCRTASNFIYALPSASRSELMATQSMSSRLAVERANPAAVPADRRSVENSTDPTDAA